MSETISNPKKDGNQYFVTVTVTVKGQQQTTRAYGVTPQLAKLAGEAAYMAILYNLASERDK